MNADNIVTIEEQQYASQEIIINIIERMCNALL